MTTPIIIFHNPRCSKSRQTLKLIEEAGHTPDVRRYLEHPPSEQEIRTLLSQLGMKAHDIVRKGEDLYKSLSLTPEMDEDSLITTLSKHPKLIERPIVIKGKHAIIGRPPENVQPLL